MIHITKKTKLILKDYYFFNKIFGDKLKRIDRSNREYSHFAHSIFFKSINERTGYKAFFEFQMSFRSQNIFCLRFNFGNYDHLYNTFSTTIENFDQTKHLLFLTNILKQYNRKIKPILTI